MVEMVYLMPTFVQMSRLLYTINLLCLNEEIMSMHSVPVGALLIKLTCEVMGSRSFF